MVRSLPFGLEGRWSSGEWFNDGDSYIGKNLTVVYQELTEDGKPRFPVGKALRVGY
jgi:hypothetical protein